MYNGAKALHHTLTGRILRRLVSGWEGIAGTSFRVLLQTPMKLSISALQAICWLVVSSVPWRSWAMMLCTSGHFSGSRTAFTGSLLVGSGPYSLLIQCLFACSRPAEVPPELSKFVDCLSVALYCMTMVTTLFLLLLCFTDGWIIPAPGVGPGSLRRLASGCPLLLW